jgi:hypothetical protein
MQMQSFINIGICSPDDFKCVNISKRVWTTRFFCKVAKGACTTPVKSKYISDLIRTYFIGFLALIIPAWF